MPEIPLKFLDIGFLPPNEESFHSDLDLNRHLIKNPSSTFYMQVHGAAYQDLNILDGDILLVDRAQLPRVGKTVISIREGMLKIIKLKASTKLDCQLEYWGLVIHLIRKLQ